MEVELIKAADGAYLKIEKYYANSDHDSWIYLEVSHRFGKNGICVGIRDLPRIIQILSEYVATKGKRSALD